MGKMTGLLFLQWALLLLLFTALAITTFKRKKKKAVFLVCCFYTCVCRLKAPWVPIDTIDCNSSSGAVSNCYNQPCQWSTDNRTLRGAWTMSLNPSCGYLKGWGGCSSSAHAPVTHSRWPLRWHLVGSNMKGRMNSISPGWALWFDMAAQLGKGLPSATAVLCTSSSSQGFYGWRVCLESLGTGALGGQSSVCCLPKEDTCLCGWMSRYLLVLNYVLQNTVLPLAAS